MAYQKFIAHGNLGRDVSVRMAGDNKVASFSIPTSTGFGDREVTEWIEVSCWNKTADAAEKYLAKGSGVIVEGEIGLQRYETKQGEPRAKLVMTAQKISFTSKKSETGNQAQAGFDDNGDIPF